MPCHSVPTQYRRPSVLVNAMPEQSLLSHGGSFVRNARANHAHQSIAYPLPFFALPCRPQLRSYHRLCPAYHCGSHLCLCSLIGSIHFPRFPLLFIACAHSSVSAAAFPVGLRHRKTAHSLPGRLCACIAYALPCGSLPVPCSMAQSKSCAHSIKANPKRLNPAQIPCKPVLFHAHAIRIAEMQCRRKSGLCLCVSDLCCAMPLPFKSPQLRAFPAPLYALPSRVMPSPLGKVPRRGG